MTGHQLTEQVYSVICILFSELVPAELAFEA